MTKEDVTGNLNYYTCSPNIKKCVDVSAEGEFIIMGSRGTICNAIHYYNGKIGCGNNMFLIKRKVEIITLKYIYYYLKENSNILEPHIKQTTIS